MEAQTRYARNGTVHIAYRVFGCGPRDIVLVPGTVSHVELYWELPANAYLLRRLTAFARVIVFDKRGQGLSDRCADQGLDLRVGDVLAVMDAAGSERATVYGWSEGGQVSLTLASQHPERVEALVLYGSYASKRSPAWTVSREDFDRFLESVASQWGEGALVRLCAPRRLGDPSFVADFGRLERAVASPSAILSLLRASFDIDVTPLLRSITQPTLILHREGDALVPVAAGRDLARQIPGAKYVELPGDDHLLQALDQEVLDTLLDEIEELVTGRRPLGGHDDPRDTIAELERAVESVLEKLETAIEIHRRQGGAKKNAASRAVFRLEGDYWTVSWRGKVVRMKDAKGLQYIAYLLSQPGRRVPASELAGRGGSLGDAGAILDGKARDSYRRRIEELRGEMNDADGARGELLRAELEALEDQLASAVGLGGRDRKACSHAERARLMVTKAIKAAISKLRACDASLGRYLATSIKTGHACGYEPDSMPPVWQL